MQFGCETYFSGKFRGILKRQPIKYTKVHMATRWTGQSDIV